MHPSNPSPDVIPLELIRIASPCSADWSKMSGDDRSRFCASCAKNVYDFSAMTRLEAQQLILEKEGHLCVRLHRRADGTIITSDCPVGLSVTARSKRSLRGIMTAVAAVLVSALGVRAASEITVTAGAPMLPELPSQKSSKPTMGSPAVPPTLMGQVAISKSKRKTGPVKKVGKNQRKQAERKVVHSQKAVGNAARNKH
ncbi:hypothetical protein EON80_02545 [bacterium]|nr:MAG: hypothetical protein EON80_02545 [bacterium]